MLHNHKYYWKSSSPRLGFVNFGKQNSYRSHTRNVTSSFDRPQETKRISTSCRENSKMFVYSYNTESNYVGQRFQENECQHYRDATTPLPNHKDYRKKSSPLLPRDYYYQEARRARDWNQTVRAPRRDSLLLWRWQTYSTHSRNN